MSRIRGKAIEKVFRPLVCLALVAGLAPAPALAVSDPVGVPPVAAPASGHAEEAAAPAGEREETAFTVDVVGDDGDAVVSAGVASDPDEEGAEEPAVAPGEPAEEWMCATIAGQISETAVSHSQVAASGERGGGVTYDLDAAGVLTISGTNTGGVSSSDFEGRTDIKKVVIKEGVTDIGSFAFSGCTSLESVEISSSVKHIGVKAFAGCASLRSVSISDGVVSIGVSAFAGCTSLESVEIPSSVEDIGVEAFAGCTGKTKISVDNFYDGLLTGASWSGGAEVYWSKVKISATVSSDGGGTAEVLGGTAVNGGKVFTKSDGGNITLKATPDSYHAFKNWTENGNEVVGNDGNPVGATYTFALSDDSVNRNLTANFKPAITITAACQTWAYDGTEHSNETVTVTSGSLADGDRLVATATGKVTNVGDTSEGNNEIDEGYKVMHGAEDVTGNYIITPVAGTLTVTPAPLTVTAKDQSFPYNGQKQGPGDIVYEDGSAVIVEGLKGDDKLTAVTVDGQGDLVGTYDLVPSDAAIGEDGALNGNYKFSYVNGTLTIEKAEVTVTTGSASKVYDGKALTNAEASIAGLVNGETATVKATGSQTEVGSSPNTYSVDWGTTDAKNYTVTEKLGTLTIESAPAKPEYKVVSGADGTWTEGSGAPLTFKVERTVDPETAFAHFAGIEVDGKAVPEKDGSGKANWTAKSGSVIVELRPSYLSTLSEGKHTLAVLFDDGDPASAEFTVQAKAKPTPTPTPTPSPAKPAAGTALPRTDDPFAGSGKVVVGLVAIGGALAAAGIVLRRRKG